MDSLKINFIWHSIWNFYHIQTRDTLSQETSPFTSLMPQSHCAEYTAEWGRIDHSSLYGWSFLVILAMTMRMTIHSNSVLLMHVASAGQYESFEHVQKFVYPARIIFISAYAHWKLVVIVSVAQLTCCILVVLTVYYIIRACNISEERSANVTQ